MTEGGILGTSCLKKGEDNGDDKTRQPVCENSWPFLFVFHWGFRADGTRLLS